MLECRPCKNPKSIMFLCEHNTLDYRRENRDLWRIENLVWALLKSRSRHLSFNFNSKCPKYPQTDEKKKQLWRHHWWFKWASGLTYKDGTWDTTKETIQSLIAHYCQSRIIGIIPLGNLQCGNKVHDTLEYKQEAWRFKTLLQSTKKFSRRPFQFYLNPRGPKYPQTNEKEKKFVQISLTVQMSFCINLKQFSVEITCMTC